MWGVGMRGERRGGGGGDKAGKQEVCCGRDIAMDQVLHPSGRLPNLSKG
jgi:hypothetical protein